MDIDQVKDRIADISLGYGTEVVAKYKYKQELDKIAKTYRTNQRSRPNARRRAVTRAGKGLEKNRKLGGKIRTGIGVSLAWGRHT